MKKLNERITYARTKAGFSKAYIARSVGVSSPTVTDWESGKIKTIEAGNLLKLAQVLNVDPEWLQTGKESRNRVDAPVDISALINVATPTYMETLKILQQAQDAGVLEDSDKAMLKIIADKYKDRL